VRGRRRRLLVVNLRFSPLFSSLFYYLALKNFENRRKVKKREEKRRKEKPKERVYHSDSDTLPPHTSPFQQLFCRCP
jgi:hypothetical protein